MSIHHAAVNVGTPTSGFQEWQATQARGEWETTPVLFHGFADLTTTKGGLVCSPEFTRFGHQWRLDIFPGGSNGSDDGMVAIFLGKMSEKSIKVSFTIIVKGLNGRDVAKENRGAHLLQAGSGKCLGYKNYAKRSDILNVLVAGTLVMEVEMKHIDPSGNSVPFTGENPSRHMLRDLLVDETSADVVFEVEGGEQEANSNGKRLFEVEDGGQDINGNGKRSRTSNVVKFHAHKFILKRCAPMLAARCPAGEGLVSVTIDDIAPDIFGHTLTYAYGEEVDQDGYKSHAKEIIEAADRYELVNLKLEAEAKYIKSNQINFENVMELLHYSDSKNLALLKEEVIDFIVDNADKVLHKVSLKDAPEGVVADLVAAVSREKKKSSSDTGNGDLTSMRISDLRRKLHEKGLSIDGSREMLIAALESA